MSEPEAHRYIEKQAMDRCVTRQTIAEEIIKNVFFKSGDAAVPGSSPLFAYLFVLFFFSSVIPALSVAAAFSVSASSIPAVASFLAFLRTGQLFKIRSHVLRSHGRG